MGAKFYKINCADKTTVGEILEGSTDPWGTTFTIAAMWDGPEKITKIDSVLNGTVKHTENRVPWHVNGDWIPIQLTNGPMSLSSTFWSGKTRLGVVTLHFVVGVAVALERAIAALVTQISFPAVKYAQIANNAGDHGRFWHTIDSWDATVKASDFKNYNRPGTNIVCLTPAVGDLVVPTIKQAEKYFASVAAAVVESGKKNILIEVINEPNLKKYCAANSDQYINNILAPAYNALAPAGIKVVGGAPSESLTYLKGLVSRGYLKLCDYPAFHAYQRTVQQHVDVSRAAKDIVGDARLIATEWNGHLDQGGLTLAEWAAVIPDMFEQVRHLYYMIHYYRITVSGQYAGKAGLFADKLGTKGTAFLKSFNTIPG